MMTPFQAKLILAYAENDMRVKDTGKQLYMSSPSICYNLDKIQKEMGWNPRKFYDLCYLVGIAAQRVNGSKNKHFPIGDCT